MTKPLPIYRGTFGRGIKVRIGNAIYTYFIDTAHHPYVRLLFQKGAGWKAVNFLKTRDKEPEKEVLNEVN